MSDRDPYQPRADVDNWGNVEANIKRHEGGCWTWVGAPLTCNVYRFVAEAYGSPLPVGRKLYRIPGCIMGKECVNPSHLGIGVDGFMLAQRMRRQEILEPSKTATVIKLTPEDGEFLRSLRISWE
jgi:hypothetical protein